MMTSSTKFGPKRVNFGSLPITAVLLIENKRNLSERVVIMS